MAKKNVLTYSCVVIAEKFLKSPFALGAMINKKGEIVISLRG